MPLRGLTLSQILARGTEPHGTPGCVDACCQYGTVGRVVLGGYRVVPGRVVQGWSMGVYGVAQGMGGMGLG